jgi:multiple sugar transport system permease protein
MQGFFAAVPAELVEAAVVDGASEGFALWRVVLPIATPGVVATALFSMLLSWNEFPIALVLTGEHAKTIPVAATTLIAERTIYWDRVSATGVLAMVPTVLIAFLIQRHLVRGLAAGAIR